MALHSPGTAGLPSALAAQGVANSGVRTAVIGDSLTADAKDDTATSLSWRAVRYPTWLRMLSGQRIRLTHDGVFATGGFSTTQIIATHLANAAAYAPQLAIVLAGTNNITLGTGYAQTIADLTTIYTTMRNAGANVIAVAIPPRTAASGQPAAQTRLQGRLNRWIAEYCRSTPGMYFADVCTPMLDFATGYASATMISADGTHPTILGAQTMARVIADIVNVIVPARSGLFADLHDVYHATENPSGNVLVNGVMAGSVAVGAATGISGVNATGWAGVIQTPGTITAALSKEADASGLNLERQVITLGGTGNAGSQPGGGSRVGLQYGLVADLAAGDRVILEAEVEWTGLQGVNGIYPNFNLNSPSGLVLADNYTYLASDGDLPASSGGRLVLRTPEFLVPAGYVNSTLTLGVYTKASGTLAGTIKWGRVSIRKVQSL